MSVILIPYRLSYFVRARFLVVISTKITDVTFYGGKLIVSEFAYPMRTQEFHLLMNSGRIDIVRVCCCLSKDIIVGGWVIHHNEKDI